MKKVILFSKYSIKSGAYKSQTSHVQFNSAQTRAVSIDLFYSIGDFYSGDINTQRYKINWRPNKNLFISGQSSSNHIDLPNESIKTRLYSLSNEIALSNKWSWSTIIQYDNLSQSIGSSSRIQWKPNAFYIYYLQRITQLTLAVILHS